MSTAQYIKNRCTTIARGGFDLAKGVLWQTKRVNARPFYFPIGRLLAERRAYPGATASTLGCRGLQTDALYAYPDGSMLVVHRTTQTTKLVATQGHGVPELFSEEGEMK